MSHDENDRSSQTRASNKASSSDVEQRLERIEAQLDQLLSMRAQAETAGNIAVDTFDEHVRSLQDRGVDIEQRTAETVKTLELFTAPETQDALRTLLELAPAAAEQAENLPSLLAILADTFDEAVRALDARGVDISALADTTAEFLHSVVEGSTATRLRSLLESDILDPAFLQVVERAASALVQTSNMPPDKSGLFAAMRALRDPMVQHTIDFSIRFAKRFGDLGRPRITE